jgi:hypothetical protein
MDKKVAILIIVVILICAVVIPWSSLKSSGFAAVTNVNSAHEKSSGFDQSIDDYYNSNGNKGESAWSFHVWTTGFAQKTALALQKPQCIGVQTFCSGLQRNECLARGCSYGVFTAREQQTYLLPTDPNSAP